MRLVMTLGVQAILAFVSPAAHSILRDTLLPCGEAFYYSDKYTCYDSNFLCPLIDSKPTLRCGNACYLSSMYSCSNNELVYPPDSSASTTTSIPEATPAPCLPPPEELHIKDPPFDNYFYSDCHSTSQVVVTSPLESSNLSIIAPRLLVAWPAGNSGVVAYFAPTNGVNGSLSLSLHRSRSGSNLEPVFIPANDSSRTGNARVGVMGLIELNSSAQLTVSILGSIRTIRDFVEGPSILTPELQDGIVYERTEYGAAMLSRVWLDNNTYTTLSFTPTSGANASVVLHHQTFIFGPGIYRFNATLDYPQLTPLNASTVLASSSQSLVTSQTRQTKSLALLSYTDKLLAGAWRFLTYFGRDSMISLLLMQRILSVGENGAIEAVIISVLERVNRSDGAVCHEEVIGDYATYANQLAGLVSTNPLCTYQMIDTDLYLPIILQDYFLDTSVGRSRRATFFSQEATLSFGNKGLPYSQIALLNAERIMSIAAPFAAPGNQTLQNLHHLILGEDSGEWRDGSYGLGGGRYPFDVNTSLVPAALYAIAALASAGVFPSHPEWPSLASHYAHIWEDSTLAFFVIDVPASEAQSLVSHYAAESSFPGPTHASNITADISFYALALHGNNDQEKVRVMHTDTAFNLFLLNSTNDKQLSALLSATATSILQPFPIGLMTNVGLLVANPAYGGNPVYAQNWTRTTYQGTVVWGWPMAMMAAGLEGQLERCDVGISSKDKSSTAVVPAFCKDTSLYGKVKRAYNVLWDVIEANTGYLNQEVWTWQYGDGTFKPVPFGNVSPTESDIIQLWSLAFLAVTRNEGLR